jgi:hypothetical protein
MPDEAEEPPLQAYHVPSPDQKGTYLLKIPLYWGMVRENGRLSSIEMLFCGSVLVK